MLVLKGKEIYTMDQKKYHDLSFKCIYHSKKRLYLGLWKAKTLVNNEQYEFKFEVENVGKKPFPGGTLEFHGFLVDAPRPSPPQPPQTITIGPDGPKIAGFEIPSLKPKETKESSKNILEFYTTGTIKLSGTLKSDDSLSVMHRRAGTRKPNGRWTTGVSSGFKVFLKLNSQDVIRAKIILNIVIATLIIAIINFIMAWDKCPLGWILNILSKR
jgi:hypothetical protein